MKLYETQDQFWDELFLLKVNIPFLERCILRTTEEHLLQLQVRISYYSNIFNQLSNKYMEINPRITQDVIQAIFCNACIVAKEGTKIRVAHALEVCSALDLSLRSPLLLSPSALPFSSLCLLSLLVPHVLDHSLNCYTTYRRYVLC